ncbi:Bifunctional peptidase and arginyl-hydroxylase JMJD5 [Pseudolycoriella hygida]|uniref:39S ribosomal protein L33, mitochondrial n=1 Tax=Pseudolycoriella hygida TaxID=35572 RepID=A0A9Q0MS84_9DIPT|nr:Bifunctional peptidase and arginyl-hydroxylase JMJD5 [Pseudolycoriella hygida]
MSFPGGISFKLNHLIPDYEQVELLCSHINQQSHKSILSFCYDVVSQMRFGDTPDPQRQSIDRALFLVSSLKDKIYEILNVGRWSEVDENICKVFSVVTFLEAFFRLSQIPQNISIEKVLYDLDFGLMLGCPLSGTTNTTLTETIRIIEEMSPTSSATRKQKASVSHPYEGAKRSKFERESSSIVILQRPSVEHFHKNHFITQNPALLQECMDHWPAMKNWKQPGYLVSVGGERTVPIEIGSHYTNENWSQDLVKFKDFLNRQISDPHACDRIEYLAQHNLFDQIPALRNDILTPEYCCVGTSNETVDIKAWLGPKGTVSPMHHDPKHNLLCQVFGHKKIILAAPEDTPNLYPHQDQMLANTTQIDAENIDLDKFPLCSNVRFYNLNLYEGEMLYIPPKWWHYVRSMDKSFSGQRNVLSIIVVKIAETPRMYGFCPMECRRDIMVLMESVVSGHQFTKIRERLGDKLEIIRFDPYIQKMSLYRERKKIRSM